MIQELIHNTDARGSTNNNAGRDLYNHYYTFVQGSSSQLAPPLSFNDAPIHLLSSHFTGREQELDYIGKVFSTVDCSSLLRCVVHGMQGLGKTQLALRYAESSYNRQQYSHIFWISGATVEKLNQGLTKVLTLVGHADRDHPEQSIRLTSARRWLEDSSKWLLIVDNISQEAVSFLREHSPRNNATGSILITTRTKVVAEATASMVGQQHHVFELRAPDLKDAANLFLSEAGINTSNMGPASTSSAEALVKRIGCLPLAISHAASFAKQSHMDLNDVLNLYQNKHIYEVRCNLLFLASSLN
jgi:hypothetical protein